MLVGKQLPQTGGTPLKSGFASLLNATVSRSEWTLVLIQARPQLTKLIQARPQLTKHRTQWPGNATKCAPGRH